MFSFRGLLLNTLMTSVWFYGSTAICKQQYKDPGHPEPGPVDLDCFRLRATAGDAQTAYQLGRCYLLGTGVSQDYAEAAMWFEKAASFGLSDAQFALGFLYEHGQGVKQEYKQAAFYYLAAAKQGHATAQNNLASLYEHGQGLPQSLPQAVHWYQLAADQGEVVAQCNLATLYFRGRGVPGIAADYTEAGKWTRLAAEQGYAPAQTDLAYLYEQGKGVPLDYVNAYAWYRAASSAGDKRAEAKLKELAHRMTPRQISIATNRAEEMQRAWRLLLP